MPATASGRPFCFGKHWIDYTTVFPIFQCRKRRRRKKETNRKAVPFGNGFLLKCYFLRLYSITPNSAASMIAKQTPNRIRLLRRVSFDD